MQKDCKQCAESFEFLSEDKKVCQKFDLPEPKCCPDCRMQRRLTLRNERQLYRCTCALCKKSFVSVYSPDKPYTVYCSECWWSDNWDPLEYARDFDFSRPFFEQFDELQKAVPLLGNVVMNSVNCDYNNYIIGSKDCYLSTRVEGENILYSYLSVKCLGCVDGFDNFHCQYCYECIDCWNCYSSSFCQLSKNLSDCMFCYDCIGCNNCFGSIALRNKQYYFFNKKCSKEEYEKLLKEANLDSCDGLNQMRKRFDQEKLKYPHKQMVVLQSQNVLGDYISESKDVYNAYDIEKTDTVRNSWGIEYGKDVYDSCFLYYGENCYEHISTTNSMNIMFCNGAYEGCHDLKYSVLSSNNTHDCFGCISLKHKQYCILNKQYSKEEYEELVPKIIEHMKKTGEYGEFFPIEISPFAYNETIAQDYYPLKKEEALAKGYGWKDPDEREYLPQNYIVPDKIGDVPDTIINEILACETCKKNYKIVPAEMKIYKKRNIPIPHKCPDCRHKIRLALRNPKELWDRKCAKCSKDIKTTYSPERPEIVYCESCYLAEVY